MADNTRGGSQDGSNPLIATDEVTHSGDTADVQLTRPVHVAGSEGSKTVTDITGPDGLLVNINAQDFGALEVIGEGGSLQVHGNVGIDGGSLVDVQNFTGTSLAVNDNGGTLTVDDGGSSLTVDGVVTLGAGSAAIGKLAANSGVDIGDVDVTSLPALPAGNNNIGDVDIASSVTLVTKFRADTATLTNVAGSASSVTLLSVNTSRLGATIHNDSAAILYVKFGITATTSSYTVKMVPDAHYEIPFGYTGRLDGIWASATGAARITELT